MARTSFRTTSFDSPTWRKSGEEVKAGAFKVTFYAEFGVSSPSVWGREQRSWLRTRSGGSSLGWAWQRAASDTPRPSSGLWCLCRRSAGWTTSGWGPGNRWWPDSRFPVAAAFKIEMLQNEEKKKKKLASSKYSRYSHNLNHDSYGLDMSLEVKVEELVLQPLCEARRHLSLQLLHVLVPRCDEVPLQNLQWAREQQESTKLPHFDQNLAGSSDPLVVPSVASPPWCAAPWRWGWAWRAAPTCPPRLWSSWLQASYWLDPGRASQSAHSSNVAWQNQNFLFSFQGLMGPAVVAVHVYDGRIGRC